MQDVVQDADTGLANIQITWGKNVVTVTTRGRPGGSAMIFISN